MGACLSRSSRRHSNALSDTSSSTGAGNGNGLGTVTSWAKNRPLRNEKIRWKSDIPLTDGQLQSKRDEFWDTAPAFEGKSEIWNALRAAAEAVDDKNQDYELAQAILDGAGISIPNGSLAECYDELGTRYIIPVYCLSYPINIISDGDEIRSDSPADFSEPVAVGEEKKGTDLKLRIRISSEGASKDTKLIVNSESSVYYCKRKLQDQEKLKEVPTKQRWYFGGKLLPDKSKIGIHDIPSGFVVQCVLNTLTDHEQ